MKLNRAHALLLVGTIAAAGCVVDETNEEKGSGGEGGEGTGAKGGTGGKAGTGTGGSAGSATTGGSAGQGNAGEPNAAGSSGASEAGASGAAGASGGQGGESGQVGAAGTLSGAGSGGEGGASECDDTQAVQLSCEGLASGSCDISGFLDDECAMTWQVMKPSISNLARNCMLELGASAICDATNTYDCIENALKASCPDATAPAACDSILTVCSEQGMPVEAETCSTYMSGLNAAGRDQFATCMAQACDFRTCAEGLTYPSSE